MIESINDISIVSLKVDLVDSEIFDQIYRRNWDNFNVCIDLLDTAEWTFFSESYLESAQALRVLQDYGDSALD